MVLLDEIKVIKVDNMKNIVFVSVGFRRGSTSLFVFDVVFFLIKSYRFKQITKSHFGWPFILTSLVNLGYSSLRYLSFTKKRNFKHPMWVLLYFLVSSLKLTFESD